jgi:hypothetical protein
MSRLMNKTEDIRVEVAHGFVVEVVGGRKGKQWRGEREE